MSHAMGVIRQFGIRRRDLGACDHAPLSEHRVENDDHGNGADDPQG